MSETLESPTEANPSETIATADAVRPLAPQAKPDKGGFYWGTGRRKSAVARVRIRPGDGKFTVNKREIDQHFTEDRDRSSVVAPLKATHTTGNIDVHVNVHGGGFMGQAGAVLLGLSRALKAYDPSLESILRDNDFLTRDAREVERKKYGQRGAPKKIPVLEAVNPNRFQVTATCVDPALVGLNDTNPLLSIRSTCWGKYYDPSTTSTNTPLGSHTNKA